MRHIKLQNCLSRTAKLDNCEKYFWRIRRKDKEPVKEPLNVTSTRMRRLRWPKTSLRWQSTRILSALVFQAYFRLISKRSRGVPIASFRNFENRRPGMLYIHTNLKMERLKLVFVDGHPFCTPPSSGSRNFPL